MAKGLAGLNLNPEKGALLLPAGAPDPAPEVRELFTEGFHFEREGFRVAGGPVGTPKFIKGFLAMKVAEADAKLQAIKQLGLKDVRAAHRLLIACASKLMSFLAAVVPPAFSIPYLQVFDDKIKEVFFALIDLSTQEPDARLQRALLRVSLPPPVGCGLFSSADRARVAWWSSVSSCLSDELLYDLRQGLAGYAAHAHKALIELFGSAEDPHWLTVSHLFPENAGGLLAPRTHPH